MTIHNFGLQEPPEANRTLQDALRRLHPANPATHWANPAATTTAGQLLRRLILVSDWVNTGRRAQVQVTRHREMGRALEVIETMHEGTHAGYERAFTHHWEQVRRAMLRDGWGDTIRTLEETERTTTKEANTA